MPPESIHCGVSTKTVALTPEKVLVSTCSDGTVRAKHKSAPVAAHHPFVTRLSHKYEGL